MKAFINYAVLRTGFDLLSPHPLEGIWGATRKSCITPLAIAQHCRQKQRKPGLHTCQVEKKVSRDKAEFRVDGSCNHTELWNTKPSIIKVNPDATWAPCSSGFSKRFRNASPETYVRPTFKCLTTRGSTPILSHRKPLKVFYLCEPHNYSFTHFWDPTMYQILWIYDWTLNDLHSPWKAHNLGRQMSKWLNKLSSVWNVLQPGHDPNT